MIALAPEELGPVLSLRGLLALERGKLSDALAKAERAVALSPWDARGWFVRGRVRLERMALGGLADLQKAAELSGQKDADILQALADAQHLAGQRDAAVQTLRQAIRLRPEDKSMKELLRQWESNGIRP
jgi:Flp pilus assembly protein TadD